MTFVRILILVFLVVYGFSMGQYSDLNAFGTIVAMSFFVTAPALYLLPIYEAWKREQDNLTVVALVNIFLGWSLIGWVVALAMACKSKTPAKVEVVQVAPMPINSNSVGISVADELTKLATLKEKGLLDEKEFTEQKAKILNSGL